ncbi:MAG TPA: lysylphosphatidylglycerol synthase domain-containing protein [Gemmatimonadales bacterium]|nr:lysylphosphatidylglycerol synthase domain-containing protein [Gemmatimonadales bacterium]
MSRTTRLVLFLVGAGLVTLLVWKSGPRVLIAGLRASAWVVAALIPLWTLVYLLNAIAWRMLTSEGGKPIPLPRAFVMTLVTFAVNYSTPLLSMGGEPLKVLAATPALGRARAMGSVVAFRLLHALAHGIAFLAALVPAAVLLPHTAPVAGVLLSVGAVLVLLVTFLLSRHREGLAIHALGLLRRIPLLRRLAVRLEPRTAAFHEVDAHVTAIYTSAPRRFYAALGVEMVARFFALSEYWVILWGMGLGVNPWKAMVVASFSSLMVNLFVFLPFELGAKEGALYLMFGWLGITPALGLAAALLSRLRELVAIAVGWALIWTVDQGARELRS